jgi:hypothetical protein
MNEQAGKEGAAERRLPCLPHVIEGPLLAEMSRGTADYPSRAECRGGLAGRVPRQKVLPA